MIRDPWARRAFLTIVLSCAAWVPAGAFDQSVPVPKPRPVTSEPATVALPYANPDEARPRPSPFEIPVPTLRPEAGAAADGEQKTTTIAVLPAEEAACRARLSAMGVEFSPAERIDGKGGCGVAWPIRVTGLPQGIKLSGRAVMGCEVSEALANWTLKVAAPEAEKLFGEKLQMVEQYASYVCRTRNSQAGAKLSEHGKGSAIDLGRFHLSGGTVVDVASKAEKGTPEQLYLQALRDEGCTYFTTVLGPGSDAFHDSHFHFDMAKRRNGFRYCR